MGAETLVPLAISALGTGVQAYNARNTAKRQDHEAARGIQQQRRRQQDADTRVSSEIDAIERSNPDEARRKSTDAYLNQLRRNRGAAAGADPLVGGTRFQEDTSSVAPELAQYGANRADVMSRISAPGMQRQREGIGFGRLASDISGIGRNSQGDAFLSELRTRGIQSNPWMDILGSGLNSYGQAMASGAFSRPKVEDQLVTLDNGFQFTNFAPARVR